MSEERELPPTEHRIQNLRKEGEVPFSADLLQAALLGILYLAILKIPLLASALSFPKLGGQLPTKDAWLQGCRWALGVIAAGAFAAFLCGLIQTRFVAGPLRRVVRKDPVWWSVLKGAGLLAAAAALLFDFVRNVTVTSEPSLSALLVAFSERAASFLGLFLFVSLLSWVIHFVLFLQRNRMSRAEVEAESRELEARPEVRLARSQFLQE